MLQWGKRRITFIRSLLCFFLYPGIQVSTSTPFTRYNGQPVIMSPPSNISDTYTHQKELFDFAYLLFE